MEAYIRMEISDGLLQQLKTQLNEAQRFLSTTATNHAEGGSNENCLAPETACPGYVDNAANELKQRPAERQY